MLMENARRKGAEVREQTAVTRVIRDESGRTLGVAAKGADGVEREFFAPVTIDCSGREQVAVGREGWRVKDPQLDKLAIWTYYRGARRDPGAALATKRRRPEEAEQEGKRRSPALPRSSGAAVGRA